MQQAEPLEYIERFQELIDLQARLLFEPQNIQDASSIYKVRREIANTMRSLLQNTTSELSVFETSQKRLDKLQSKVSHISQESKEARRLAVINQRETEVVYEIQQLESRLSKLKQERTDIQNLQESLTSIIGARSSSYLGEIELIGNNMKPLIKKYPQIIKEKEALDNGLVVWSLVCNRLKEMERDMAQIQKDAKEKGLKGKDEEASGGNGNDSSGGGDINKSILELLKSGLEFLTTQLDTAVAENWSLLTVAISHEVEAVRNAISIINSREKQD